MSFKPRASSVLWGRTDFRVIDQGLLTYVESVWSETCLIFAIIWNPKYLFTDVSNSVGMQTLCSVLWNEALVTWNDACFWFSWILKSQNELLWSGNVRNLIWTCDRQPTRKSRSVRWILIDIAAVFIVLGRNRLEYRLIHLLGMTWLKLLGCIIYKLVLFYVFHSIPKMNQSILIEIFLFLTKVKLKCVIHWCETIEVQ